MVQESSCETKWMAAARDAAAEGAQPCGLDRQRFLMQLTNALTTLNGLVYLTHRADYHTEQKYYIEAMQDKVEQITQAIHQHRLTPGGRPSE